MKNSSKQFVATSGFGGRIGNRCRVSTKWSRVQAVPERSSDEPPSTSVALQTSVADRENGSLANRHFQDRFEVPPGTFQIVAGTRDQRVGGIDESLKRFFAGHKLVDWNPSLFGNFAAQSSDRIRCSLE